MQPRQQCIVAFLVTLIAVYVHGQCSCGDTQPPPFDYPDERGFFFCNPTVDGNCNSAACLANCSYTLWLSDDCATLYRGFAVSLYGYQNANDRTQLCFYDGATSLRPLQCVTESVVIDDLFDSKYSSVRIEARQPATGNPSSYTIALVPAGGAKKFEGRKPMGAIKKPMIVAR